jgi:dolichol-phosphate mannosyltransferase
MEELVRRVHQACSSAGMEAEIIIVDDNSPDGTGAYAEELGRSFNVKVIHRSGKLGLSSAVLEGFAKASGSILVVMDADLSHPPESIPRMVSKIEAGEADVVVGSRYVEGGGAENWPYRRKLISKGATILARPLTKIKDPMSGFFALKRSVIEGVALDPVGYKIGLEVIVKGHVSKVAEVPILFANRKAGKSKLGGFEMLRYIDHVTRLYESKRFWLAKYLKFAIIGGIGTVINLAIYAFLIYDADVEYHWAAAIAFIVADTNNFIWNRWWTFRSKEKPATRYFQFLIISLIGLGLNQVLLTLLVDRILPSMGLFVDQAKLRKVVSQVMAIFAVSLYNFAANSLWTFRSDVKKQK